MVILGPASSRVTAVRRSTVSEVDVLSHARKIINTSSTPMDSTKKRAATIIDWNFIPKKQRIPVEDRRANKGMKQPITDSQGLDLADSCLFVFLFIIKSPLPSRKNQNKENHCGDRTHNERSCFKSHPTNFSRDKSITSSFTLKHILLLTLSHLEQVEAGFFEHFPGLL